MPGVIGSNRGFVAGDLGNPVSRLMDYGHAEPCGLLYLESVETGRVWRVIFPGDKSLRSMLGNFLNIPHVLTYFQKQLCLRAAKARRGTFRNYRKIHIC